MRVIALMFSSAASIASLGAIGSLSAMDAFGTFCALSFAAAICYGSDSLKRRRARHH